MYGYPNQGRVSLFYNGQWGTVCDDEWDMNDAHVVCRMLGYPKALAITTESVFGGGAQDEPIWLDEVNCTGNEDTLAACPHVGWGNSDCDHTEDAGVICDFNYTVDAKGKRDVVIPSKSSLSIKKLVEKKKLKMTNILQKKFIL